ncbi:uncharacterized protein VTP21DRAFT_8047 [Calcarisporiella thermophila]|uniref:uncharacterized protein n=1 Tax=Calcarisporiella thermophila TaxID=911321 RepID=UPI003743D96D
MKFSPPLICILTVLRLTQAENPLSQALRSIPIDINHYALDSRQIWACQQYVKLIAIAKCVTITDNFKCPAYCSEFPGTVLIDNFKLGKDDITGYIARDDRRKAIVISLRGTLSASNLVVDMRMDLVPYPNPASMGARVHKGGLKASQIFSKSITPQICELLRSNPDYEVEILGHSLGGGLALLLALNLIESVEDLDKNKMVVVTVGEPRVGDKKFVEYFESFKILSKRLVGSLDVVPYLPYNSLGYWVSH